MFKVIDFYADWCKPCQLMEPVLHELESELNFPLEKVDVMEKPDLQQKYSIMSIPTLVFFNEDKEVGRTIGFQDKKKLTEEIKKYL